LFLFSFFTAGYLTEIFNNFSIEIYGLFGMIAFMAFLAHLIVRYKAFNIKLLGAQALVAALAIGIGSQFFFIQNPTNKILNGITFAISLGFGYFLVKSVEKVDRQKEELEIANDKIQKDKEIVEKANVELVNLDKAKTEFINIASHQLRTPISVISGVASMMLEGDIDRMPPEQRQKFYRSVWEKTKKLKFIVHDILNATSFANQKFSVVEETAETIDVPAMLGKIIGDFDMEVKERGIDLELHAEENVPPVKGQQKYLEEAFINLINNAIKYTPSANMTNDVRKKRERGERGRIAVSVKKDPGNPQNVLVEIADNGIGIPKEAKEKLFHRFSRAQNAVDMYTDGTGLGLFIVKEIAEGHGGKVWFESELGKGTSFFVNLPTSPKFNVDIKKRVAEDSKD
jgi:signal transduction histidine kinase